MARWLHRYGFNGQEHSTEIGDDDYTAQFWEYDSRIGRRWNVDPVTKEWESPYACLSNNPIWNMDPNGDSDSSLSKNQLVDALKIASNEVKNSLQSKTFVWSDKAKSRLAQAYYNYAINHDFNLEQTSQFIEATRKFHDGLATLAMVSSADFYTLQSKVIYNRSVNNKNTLDISVYAINKGYSNFHTILSGSGKALETAMTAGLATFGSGLKEPTGTRISSQTQQRIVNAKTVAVENEIQLTKKAFGHTFTTHGEDMTDFLANRARGSGEAQGQFLDNQAAARFINSNLGLLKNGAQFIPIPKNFPARIINPNGTYGVPTQIKLVPSGNGVKTAYPTY